MSVGVLCPVPWLQDGLLFLRLHVSGRTARGRWEVQGQERPSRSTGVEYEDAGRDGLRESTGEVLGLIPFCCCGEEVVEVDMGVTSIGD